MTSTWSPPPPVRPSAAPIGPLHPVATGRSQVAVYAVVAVAVLIAGAATGIASWAVAGSIALGAGVAIGIAAHLERRFASVPGALAATFTAGGLGILLVLVWSRTGPILPFATVPVVGLFVLGLDWSRVERLRPLPFASGFLVVLGMLGQQTWTYPAAAGWLVLALGALASLEADRRAAQPPVVPTTSGPSAPPVRTTDLVTTILIALAVALIAGLILSTPSCRRPGDPTGGRVPNGTGLSGIPGSGSSATDHRYVPDPNGHFLIPSDGSGGSGPRIPSPEDLPTASDPSTGQRSFPDGTSYRYRRGPDGSITVTVTEPGRIDRTYVYRKRSDGLTEIQELDRDGNVRATYWYDPKGKVATDDRTTVDQTPPPDDARPPDQQRRPFRPNWRLIGLIVLIVAAVAALVWAIARRTPKAPVGPAPVPPWALALARDMELQGRRRGRPRAGSESLVRYGAALANGPLPDPRLREVADVVSTALFARVDPGHEAQARAEATWAQIVEAHPAPSRRPSLPGRR